MTPNDSHALAGRLLAAKPELLDPNFRQSLVFIIEHNDEGSFGLIMNRPTGHALADVVGEELPPCVGSAPLMLGGPVDKGRIILASFERTGSGNDFKCRLTDSVEEAEAAIREHRHIVRAFAGYSGWGGGQLADELRHDSWEIYTPSPALFENRFLPGLWSAYITGDHRWKKLLPYLPDDPSVN